MLNQFILVGRLTKTPEFNEEKTVITLAVPRTYKNEEGIYDTDYISCTLIKNVAKSTCEYYKKGDVISVRGRLESNKNMIELIVDKVIFLRSKGD